MTDLAIKNAAATEQHTRRIVGPTILMGDGMYFDFESPDASGLTIEDYAWGLASNARFRGQTRRRLVGQPNQIGPRCLYNVCQHVVLLAEQMWRDGQPIDAVYEGLMHESDEVPWPDIAGPAKQLLPSETKALIKRSGDAIDEWFGVGHEHKDIVKQYDIRMLATEKRDLMPQAGTDQWSCTGGYEPFDFTIEPWVPEYSVQRFRSIYQNVTDHMRGAA
ncbi:hypothetical protein SKP52_02435 [Sphingopyxis fribergensis]|uniref:HD domain-containing protein n=1 Tax=Sphingopyxis fribergensis TaxID=1515612 RepID=A0A0A7PHJ7_9SPHN|nr:hypothetical protein [Sphingopyxis fribergensis]AJA07422.1 hypothetical protein SKP52_02435 [Sphingopyxis fribergensis]